VGARGVVRVLAMAQERRVLVDDHRVGAVRVSVEEDALICFPEGVL
jgi:hypothetical protein